VMPNEPYWPSGANKYDPAINILAGAKHLADDFKATGSWSKALGRYFGAQDQSYIQSVLRKQQAYRQ
jgi:hypothetical protein